jgi:hypothetical protein
MVAPPKPEGPHNFFEISISHTRAEGWFRASACVTLQGARAE